LKYTKEFLKYAGLIIALIVLLADNSLSQSITWQRIIDSGYGSIKKVLQTSNGDYVGVGSHRVNNEFKIYIAKLDIFGNIIWTRIIGTGDASGYWIEETFDKGYILGGDSDSKAYIAKTDSMGIIQWQKFYTNSVLTQCRCIKQTYDGGYILSCRTISNNTNSIWLIKTDSLGNIIWQKVHANSQSYGIYTSEIEIINNGYISVGWINSNPADILVMKFDLYGDTILTKRFGGIGSDICYSIQQDANGFVLCGESSSFNNDRVESYLIKTDLSFNLIWQRTYSNEFDEQCNSVGYVPNVGYIMAVDADTNSINYSQAVIRLVDLSGNIIHEKHFYPGNRGGWFNDVMLTTDRGFILGGSSNTDSFLKMYFVKTDSLLNAPLIGIHSQNTKQPVKYELYQNYPNPFNPVTNIKYEIPRGVYISIMIYDILGKEVYSYNGFKKAGSYEIMFDGTNLASGIYFYKMVAETSQLSSQSGRDVFTETKKMVLLK